MYSYISKNNRKAVDGVRWALCFRSQIPFQPAEGHQHLFQAEHEKHWCLSEHVALHCLLSSPTVWAPMSEHRVAGRSAVNCKAKSLTACCHVFNHRETDAWKLDEVLWACVCTGMLHSHVWKHFTHTTNSQLLLQSRDSRLSNDDKSFWRKGNPAHCLPQTPCREWIAQSWLVADTWGDGKPCRSFLKYYLDCLDVIASDLIDF